MKTEELIEICKQRNELEFLFSITKHIAETDSICEGYYYCNVYERERFDKSVRDKISNGDNIEYCEWLEYGAIPIYELYLYRIGVLPNLEF